MSISHKQLKALSAAEASGNGAGLSRTVAGWVDDRHIAEYHNSRTIHSLVQRRYLKFWNKGKTAHITDAGLAALREARER